MTHHASGRRYYTLVSGAAVGPIGRSGRRSIPKYDGQRSPERRIICAAVRASERIACVESSGGPPIIELANLELHTLLHDDEVILSRSRAQRVLVMTPTSASTEAAARFEQFYALRDDLDAAWALCPTAFGHWQGLPVLVASDPGGVPLATLLGRPFELPMFLRTAIGIASALARLHTRGLIHRDVKPASILVDPESGAAWLGGLGRAARTHRQRQAPEPSHVIAGTLAYMAPEQTGRMNRSIDSRTDLYALGVTLYEMLTGGLPFTASDALEWIHCHIARSAVPPHERLERVPRVVSAIVMKLLAKAAEDRYQTAAGLERDLRRCLAAWELLGQYDAFPLGERDTPDRLLIPEKLYGRARELEILLAAFERIVRGGAPELVLVSGYSGIGKSSVVHELHKVLVPTRGLFASGKFDQYKRDIPYSTLVQAVQGLIRPLLGKNDDELARWREALGEALGPNGGLIAPLIPEIELLLDPQSPVPELSAKDAQHRFQLVFRRLLGVFARPEHPLVLFLDDLQWLDAATLDLLEHLSTHAELRHLLIVGAYRDNEVSPAHPLVRRLAAIRGAGVRVHDIVLSPLALDDVRRLIGDSLRCAPEHGEPLAAMVHAKTAGNPFFVIQFVTALADEGLLAFDHDGERWSWDLERIRAVGYTDNVVDLVLGKLRRLPAETQLAVRQLACLGHGATMETLAAVRSGSDAPLDVALREAVSADLVQHDAGRWRFLHDRVQEAAYALIPEGDRAAEHLRIGRLLAARSSPQAIEEHVFEIVGQLNLGAALITSRDERERLAELNLMAGRRAKASTAYASAIVYLDAAAVLLGDDRWLRRYELTFALELNRAECEYLNLNLSDAEVRFEDLALRAASFVDVAAVARLWLELLMTLGRSDDAIQVGLDCLRRVDIAWPAHPTSEDVEREYERLWQRIAGRRIEGLVDLPRMTEPAALATMDVLTAVMLPARYTDENLRAVVVGRMLNLSVEHGNCDASCLAYAAAGTIMGAHFGDFDAGYRFAQLGLDLVEQRGLERYKARISMICGGFVAASMRHVRVARPLLRRALDTAQQTGDLSTATFSRYHFVTHLLASGDPLDEVQRAAEVSIDSARQARFGLVVDTGNAQLRLIRTLRGLTPVFGSFDDERGDEPLLSRGSSSESDLAFAECVYCIRKLEANVYAGNHRAALVLAGRAEAHLAQAAMTLEFVEYHFHAALTRAALCDTAPDAERAEHLKALSAHGAVVRERARHCPENYTCFDALVNAEIARVERRDLDAMRLYEQAIASARANGFVHREALSFEVAARFYAARGFDTIASSHRREARAGYLRWGALGKVRQLEQLFPELRDPEPPSGMTAINAPVEQLDLATVIKISQALSGEIERPKLIDVLMRTAIEHAGATRGLLIVPSESALRVEAEATTSGADVVVRLHEDGAGARDQMPESIVRYAMRAQANVIINDATVENAFSGDLYVASRRARAVACVPLIDQSNVIGVLYLENALAPQIFTPTRVAVLKLLASQAASFIENTRLYANLEERESKIRRLVDANVIGIFLWKMDGSIVDANDAFLTMVDQDREALAAGRLRWPALVAPEWLARIREGVDEVRATSTMQPCEIECLRRDGSRVPILLGAAAFEGSDNEGVAFVLDLTERKRAEQRLRRSETFLAEAQRLSSTGSFAWHVETDEITWSEQLYRIFELDSDVPVTLELIASRIYPEDVALFYDVIGRARAAGADFDIEHRLQMPDQSVKYVHVTAHGIVDKAGRFEYIGAAQDVTQRRLADDALGKVRSELAHVARVSSLGVFAASIAHELNQPLAGIITNANTCRRMLAADPPDLDGARETARRTLRDGNRASEVIARLRALFGRKDTTRESVDLNEATQEVIALSLSELQRNRVTVRTELAADLPRVVGDRVQLQQVILNLLLNASDAMAGVDDRARLLVVHTERDGANHVCLHVRDTGIGLDPDRVTDVFEPFYTTKLGGMGIGLSISRSIVESHQGRLWAASNDGPGASFSLSIPCGREGLETR